MEVSNKNGGGPRGESRRLVGRQAKAIVSRNAGPVKDFELAALRRLLEDDGTAAAVLGGDLVVSSSENLEASGVDRFLSLEAIAFIVGSLTGRRFAELEPERQVRAARWALTAGWGLR